MKGARRAKTSAQVIVLHARRAKPAASRELALRALAILAIVLSTLTGVQQVSEALARLAASDHGVRVAYLSPL